MKFPRILALLAGLASAHAQSATDGATLFNLNCAACHLLDEALVGPSLVEIRSLYLDKPDDFVKWTIAPGKKRAGAIEMPAMGHVGEPGLRAIHAHVVAISKGVTAKKIVARDLFPIPPARPAIQRIFMPDAGPAAIAVALDDKISLCWDAGPCRLRYAWTGGFIDGWPYWQGKGTERAKILGKVGYTEPAPLIPGTPAFKGYEIRNGSPVFRYYLGELEITETFSPQPSGFLRHFTISPKPAAPLVLAFPQKTTSDTGTWDKKKLTLTPDQAAAFTVTHLFP